MRVEKLIGRLLWAGSFQLGEPLLLLGRLVAEKGLEAADQGIMGRDRYPAFRQALAEREDGCPRLFDRLRRA